MNGKYLMSWEGKPHYRWVKMYRGERYRVNCAALGLPEGDWMEETSYEAANAWWNAKLAEIQPDPPAKPTTSIPVSEQTRPVLGSS